MPNRVGDETTCPFPNFNDCTFEVWKWIRNFIPHFIMDVSTYPWSDYKLNQFSKSGPRSPETIVRSRRDGHCLPWRRNSSTCVILMLTSGWQWKYTFYVSVSWRKFITTMVNFTWWFIAQSEFTTIVIFNVNTWRPEYSHSHFADDIFKCILLNENIWIALEISVRFVPKVRINKFLALFQIMTLRRPGDITVSGPNNA